MLETRSSLKRDRVKTGICGRAIKKSAVVENATFSSDSKSTPEIKCTNQTQDEHK